MDLGELNSALREKAITNGLCAKWQRDWKDDWSKETMLQKFKDGIDFCIKNNYPGIDFIKGNFTTEELRNASIIVDDVWSLVNPKEAVLMGKSKSTIRFNGHNIGTVYVCDTSSATITAKNLSRVVVHAFGNAAISAEAQDMGEILVLRHSENVSVERGYGVTMKDELDLFLS